MLEKEGGRDGREGSEGGREDVRKERREEEGKGSRKEGRRTPRMMRPEMQPEHNLSFIDKLRMMRETRFGAFVPVLLALAAIWAYFGLAVPLWEYWGDADAESFRFIFLSPRNIYNLFIKIQET